MFGPAQLMMRKTEIVAASDQIHAGLQCEYPTSGMTGFARQAGQPFAERSIQALDKSSVEARCHHGRAAAVSPPGLSTQEPSCA